MPSRHHASWPPRRCVECRKLIRPRKVIITVQVTTSAAVRMWYTYIGPLWNIGPSSGGQSGR